MGQGQPRSIDDGSDLPLGERDLPLGESERTVAFLLALRTQGVRDRAVLRAMELVPRERFAPNRFADLARTDVSVPLPCGQTMTQPTTVAALLATLEVAAGQRVLEVGTGSGYVTALLAHMGATVTSLERYRTLALAAHERLAGLGAQRVELRHADGLQPDRTLGRYERILVNGVTGTLPEALLARLAPEGLLVGALRIDGLPRKVIVTRAADGTLSHSLGGAVRLPPLASGLSQAM
ncbi:MAG: protein-L-isoaspartate O-methyltransferase family protein [Bosea sp. (in: a-proteobacteria)]